jgi:hypothetical protein
VFPEAQVPVEFLTDEQAAAFGRFVGPPSRSQLERCFLLDDDDLVLVGRRRSDTMKLGFGVQLGTVRYLGTFLADPVDVPTVVVDYVAEQLGIADASCIKAYGERPKTCGCQILGSPHATCAYSWISPPSRSRRTTLPVGAKPAGSPGSSGAACPNARCGRWPL